MIWNKSNMFGIEPAEEPLPNGHTRQEYYDAGLSDMDIEYWGMDQPGAPGPQAAGFMIMDMLDGDFDFDGEPDF